MKVQMADGQTTRLLIAIPKRNSLKKDEIIFWISKKKGLFTFLFKQFSLIMFTGALLLGASYLFFIQLAEYGW